MTTMTELWVDRGDYRQTQQVSGQCPKPAEGEILLAIDKFAMTANNVSYAASGDMIGYWRFFPPMPTPGARCRSGEWLMWSQAVVRISPLGSGCTGFSPWPAI